MKSITGPSTAMLISVWFQNTTIHIKIIYCIMHVVLKFNNWCSIIGLKWILIWRTQLGEQTRCTIVDTSSNTVGGITLSVKKLNGFPNHSIWICYLLFKWLHIVTFSQRFFVLDDLPLLTLSRNYYLANDLCFHMSQCQLGKKQPSVLLCLSRFGSCSVCMCLVSAAPTTDVTLCVCPP